VISTPSPTMPRMMIIISPSWIATLPRFERSVLRARAPKRTAGMKVSFERIDNHPTVRAARR
jgi:hypothetical protein